MTSSILSYILALKMITCYNIGKKTKYKVDIMTYDNLTDEEIQEINLVDANDNGYNDNSKKFYQVWQEQNISEVSDFDGNTDISYEYNNLIKNL